MRNREPVRRITGKSPRPDDGKRPSGIRRGKPTARGSELLFWGNIRPTWRNLSRTRFANPLSYKYSANAIADGKIKTFVAASHDLIALSAQMEGEVLSACQRMAADLGVNPAEMTPRNSDQPGAAAQAACGAVGNHIDAILRQGIQVQVQVRPPQCQANLQAKAICDGACTASVDPGALSRRASLRA